MPAEPETSRPLPSPPPAFVVRLVLALRAGLRWLADAIAPPELALFERASGVGITMALAAASRLGIAGLLEERPASAEDLARRTGIPPENMQRLLRALASIGVFALAADGRFRNNRLSRGLRRDREGTIGDFVDYFGSVSNVMAWTGFEHSLATGECAFDRVHGMPVWSWFDSHPGEREVFGRTMAALTRLHASGVATAYPFAEVARLCDVGGGVGTLLAEVMLRHPHLHGVLFDGEGVAAEARAHLAGRGLAGRVEVLCGDFFAQVPAGCDAYLLKNILHDWDDQRCLQLLAACRRAMQPGQRLLVVEALVEQDTVHDLGPLSDLQMMVVCGGRERGRDDFARLFAGASLRLHRVVPTASAMSIIEARAE